MIHASPTDLTAVRKMLPGTIVFFKWPNGTIQEAVKCQDLFEMPSAGFVFLGDIPGNTALEDVPIIVVDEDQKWHLAQ